MAAKRVWTIQSFFTCFVWNAVLVGVLYYMGQQVLLGLHKWIDPFLATGPTTLPEDLAAAFMNLNQFLKDIQKYLAPLILGTGGLTTLILWLFIMLQGRGFAARAQAEAGVRPAPPRRAKEEKEEKKPVKQQEAPPVPPEPQYVQMSPQAAIQMLALLQREGRFIDFIQEDLSLYEDAQIGAAVRNIHQGCKEALSEHVELEAIYEEAEGNEVTVPAGFDAVAIRLTGNVTGDPPFKGVLRHRGWKVIRVQLPQPTSEQKKDWILAPAEVEMNP